MQTPTIEERISRLEKLIKKMQPKKDEWVGPTVITTLTGWDKNQMRNARNNGSVKYRKCSTGGYQYLLGSIPAHFIKETIYQ